MPLQLLHKHFEKELPFIHKLRLKNVMDAASIVIRTNKLTLTALGRNFPNRTKARSRIKKVDRLLGNSYMQDETLDYYKTMTSYLVAETGQPWIHIEAVLI